MNLTNALAILLDATVELDEQPQVRRARKRVADKLESLRRKMERRAAILRGLVEKGALDKLHPADRTDCPQCGHLLNEGAMTWVNEHPVESMRCMKCGAMWERHGSAAAAPVEGVEV